MMLGRVMGTVVSTVQHPAYDGRKLLIVRALDDQGRLGETEILAVDHAQAGVGDTVLVLREGNGVRQLLVGDPNKRLPILETIVGVVDRIDIDEGGP